MAEQPFSLGNTVAVGKGNHYPGGGSSVWHGAVTAVDVPSSFGLSVLAEIELISKGVPEKRILQFAADGLGVQDNATRDDPNSQKYPQNNLYHDESPIVNVPMLGRTYEFKVGDETVCGNGDPVRIIAIDREVGSSVDNHQARYTVVGLVKLEADSNPGFKGELREQTSSYDIYGRDLTWSTTYSLVPLTAHTD